jgi:ABC-type transport system involved in Fe-S cluster assembly fused permease/ATPase subunit
MRTWSVSGVPPTKSSATIVDADEILVLERGRIVERGGHAALLAADGA